MAFLTVFGIAIPVLDSAASGETPVQIESQATFNGGQLLQRAGTISSLSVKTPILSPADVSFFEGICSNDFENFPLSTDLWSGNGRPWSTFTGASTVGSPIGAGNYWSGSVSYQRAQKTNWAVSVWVVDTLNGWQHIIVQSDGNHFTDGVASAAHTAISVTNSTISLAANLPVFGFRDLTVFDFNIPPAKVAEWWANYLPSNFMQTKLAIGGTGAPTMDALGFVGTRSIQGVSMGGNWVTNAAELDITIIEA